MIRKELTRRRVLQAAGAAGAAGATAALTGTASADGTLTGNGSADAAPSTGTNDAEMLDQCGPDTEETTFRDTISSGESHVYSYTVGQLLEVCAMNISLDSVGSDSDMDVDVYVTLDDRSPSVYDHDRAATSSDSDEEIHISESELEYTPVIGILVKGYSGSGEYVLSVEEEGRRGYERCGPDSAETTVTDRIAHGESHRLSYSVDQLDEVCEMNVYLSAVSADESDNLDLYLTLDGRTPTTADLDRGAWGSGTDERIGISEAELESTDELGILVDAVDGGATYTLWIEEVGHEDVSPSAALEVVTDDPTANEPVTLGAGDSFARADGSIERYEWNYQLLSWLWTDQGHGTGEQFTFTPDRSGTYEVLLTVTDEAGRSATAYETIQVENDFWWWWPF